MSRFTFAFALLFFAASSSAQVTATDGMNNGYLWERGGPDEKMLYVAGIGDGITLQSVAAAAAGNSRSPETLLYPKGVAIADIVAGMDDFYKERANMRIPIMFSYMYTVRKIKGATQQELDDLVVRFRRNANH